MAGPAFMFPSPLPALWEWLAGDPSPMTAARPTAAEPPAPPSLTPSSSPPEGEEGEAGEVAAPVQWELWQRKEQLLQYVKIFGVSVETKVRAVPSILVLAVAVCRAIFAAHLATTASDLFCILLLAVVASQANTDNLPTLSQFKALEAALATKAEAGEVVRLGDFEALEAALATKAEAAEMVRLEALEAALASKAEAAAVVRREDFEALEATLASKAALAAKVEAAKVGRREDIASANSVQELAALVAQKADLDKVPRLERFEELARSVTLKADAVSTAEALQALEARLDMGRAAEGIALLSGHFDQLSAATKTLEGRVNPAQETPAESRCATTLGRCSEGSGGAVSADDLVLRRALLEEPESTETKLEVKVDRLALSVDELAIAVQGKVGHEKLDELAELVEGKADSTAVLSLERMQAELQAVEQRTQADVIALLSRFHRLVGTVEHLAGPHKAELNMEPLGELTSTLTSSS